MNNVMHQSLADGRWSTLSLCQQMGNIGSEVGRALRAKNESTKNTAIMRALELYDLTLADKRWYGRGSELARGREVVCDYLLGNNNYKSTDKSLENYFMHFAMAARLSY